jgi:prepilin-type N-terminal cleavage/methylation domain-containing protein
MNRKGFTLIELIATLLILSLVLGLTVYSVSDLFKSAKDKTEDVFVETIKDALEVYLSSDAKNLDFIDGGEECRNINKTHGSRKMYRIEKNFRDVINSSYRPLTQEDLVNPADKDKVCKDASYVSFYVYRDQDYVYYYSVDMGDFGCLNHNVDVVSNLPEGYVC